MVWSFYDHIILDNHFLTRFDFDRNHFGTVLHEMEIPNFTLFSLDVRSRVFHAYYIQV